VWVDGAPRVACVTPVRRLEGRQVTTLDGLPVEDRERWAEALVATGGSQCGFCTPGIVMRLAALGAADPAGAADGGSSAPTPDRIAQSLVAHLCRCTGWQTIEEAASRVYGPPPDRTAGPRDLDAAAKQATLEGGVPQRVGSEVVLGRAGFADDSRPADALVAVPDGTGGYAVAESLAAARAEAGKVQGRSTSLALSYPVEVPSGPWDLVLATTWVEPAYVEPDASWSFPGGVPASPYGNGGAFGGKLHSPVAADARRLADQYSRPVRVLWSREDVVRHGPKRPPVAGGIGSDGTGVLRVGLSGGVGPEGTGPDGWGELVGRVAAVAPGLRLEAVPVVGPPVSFDLRGAVWVEAAVLAACVDARQRLGGEGPWCDVPIEVSSPAGGRAVARCGADGAVDVVVDGGDVLDEVVLRSYAIGATHQALSWVRSEGVAVDGQGQVCDLTVRSFGILQARAMPRVEVTVAPAEGRPPVNSSDAVFAAVAAARWLADGLGDRWPTDRMGAGRR
jgi:aerobic-type carbon monoxide dehydrogenase small subunit (CoxS/CutS family)